MFNLLGVNCVSIDTARTVFVDGTSKDGDRMRRFSVRAEDLLVEGFIIASRDIMIRDGHFTESIYSDVNLSRRVGGHMKRCAGEVKRDIEDFDAEGEREARVFTLWLNSLGVEPSVFNLFENLKDGLVILQHPGASVPGIVLSFKLPV